MKKPCGNTHPLYNPGSVQSGRKPLLLDPAKVVYEERTVSDWLVYLSNYAKHINYFQLTDNETHSGDWTSFFNRDVSVLLAKIAEEQVGQIQAEFNELLKSLQHDNLTDNQAKKRFTLLFGLIFNIVYRLNDYYINLEYKASLRNEMERRVVTTFELRLKRLIGYFKKAQELSLIDESTDNDLPNNGQPVSELDNWELVKMWYSSSAATSWKDYYDGIPADESPYLSNVLNPANPQAKINLAARYQLLVESSKGVISGFAGIISAARNEFDSTITEWPSHQPDRALLISFLKLLELYRKELNSFNKRHLDHHLKEILQLKPAAANPDKVYVVAELPKTKESTLLKAGTEITGGKDEEGKELVYGLNEDVIVNKAIVAVNKGIIKAGQNIHVAQNCATADGLEEEMEYPEEGWSAFGTPLMAKAKLGFAVASDLLDMKDGLRVIRVLVNLTDTKALNPSTVMQIGFRMKMRVTGEEGWMDLKRVYTRGSSPNQFVIRGELGPDEKAIAPFNPQIHERKGYINQPVVEAEIDIADHEYIQQFDIASVAVEVEVSGSKHATVTTPQGEVDTAKPFVAFGPLPAASNAVVIGAQEMLGKPLTKMEIQAEWSVAGEAEREGGAFNTDNGTLKFEQLVGGGWVDRNVTITEGIGKVLYRWTNLTQENNLMQESFGPSSKRGFIRLALAEDLKHKGYANELSTRMAEIAVEGLPGDTDPNIPLPYHIPSIKRLTINYGAKSSDLSLAASKNYQPENTRFYHITPFGEYEASGNMLGIPNPPLIAKHENEGEFYIGLDQAKNGEQINVLIHVLEGSANPLKAKQDVNWQLLVNNRWVDFESGGLIDGTDGLIKTGVLSISVPFSFKTSGTYFSANYTWIRATVKQHADAVCKVLGVYAQGLEAQLISSNHAATHYENALPPETAIKFKRSNPAIKKLTQPVESKGGKAPETDNNFYTRISERLRHKDRGITLWDYERLVLQDFPELSMCKALTHTKYAVDEISNEIDYSESAPGHVSVVCVPVKTTLFKPAQKPFTPVDTLEDVKAYLAQKMPPWSTLHVRNPIFEEVQVDARVAFNPNIKDTNYYLEVLTKELKELFSPWRKDNRNGLRFSWRIHKSHVIDFIDERPYVNYVRDVKLNLIYGPNSSDRKENVEEAIPRYAVSVLISSPIHVLNPVS